MKGINVLSLFDGMSCGQQALERINVKVDNYFASEIDKYAIKVTMANYPNTIQLGSVVDVDGYKLPKIDLLIGGSPCQSFSFAGKRKGMATKDEQEILTLEHYLELKSEGYEFEGQSYLFWEYMRLLNECKPTYFLLENVEMGEKWEKVLSKAIGVNGIHINSALVSAQNRKRIYWTNIGMQPSGLFGDLESIIQQPKDKCILLKDILETDVDEKYFLSEKMIAGFEKHKERHNDKGTGFGYIPKTETDKGNSLRANSALAPTDNMIIVHSTFGRTSTNGNGGNGHLSKDGDKTYCLDAANSMAVEIVAQRGRGENNEQQLEARKDGKTNCLTSVQKDNLIRQLNPSTESGGNQPYQQNRVYDVNGISPALNTDGRSHAVEVTSRIRRLTPIECERLQTVADNYTAHVSDSQRYKMLGNGWTIDVIAHIFSYLPKEIINNI
jgi:DNA (cytosine-5)-methyltransferase 3A